MKKAVLSIIFSVLFLTGIISNTYAAIPEEERAALIALYNSTDGDNWADNSGWKTPPLAPDGFAFPGTEGDWYGITLNSDDSFVEKIYFHSNQLTGYLPPELGNLSNLKWLSFIFEPITGTIPPELGDINSLEELTFHALNLTGQIPKELGNLTNLKRLNFYANQLEGSIPIELGNLVNLTDLSISCNDKLIGYIPPELGNLTNLRSLYLDGNGLSGNIPPELGNLINLENLQIGNKELTGSIPPVLGNLVKLSYLSIKLTQITGSIPPELWRLINLRYFDLGYNDLTGTIPPGIGNLTNLREINFSGNELRGSIPPEIGELTNIRTIYIGGNQFTGSIPLEIYSLTNLVGLDLSQNQLMGTIYPEIGNLTNLARLYLDNNKIGGEIPTGLKNLNSLIDFDIGYNALFSNDEDLILFLNDKDPDWKDTQTIFPNDVAVDHLTSKSIIINWTPIVYSYNSGGYIVSYGTSLGGPYTEFGITADKRSSQMEVTGLAPDTEYHFVVQTQTDPYRLNQNTIISEYSAEVSAQTNSAVCTDCRDILLSDENQGDGSYFIDPDGSGGEDSIPVECLMSLDGGGWTKLTETVSNTVVNTDPTVEREYLYVKNGKWYRTPPSQLVWDWYSPQVLTGTYHYSGGGSFYCGSSSERTRYYGVSCSNGPGTQWKALIYYTTGKNPADAQVQICQDRPGIFGSSCQTGVTVYIRKVDNSNQAPELTPIADQNIFENETLNVPLLATDADGDSITLSASGLPGFCSFADNGVGTGNITCDPGYNDSGSYNISVTAGDGIQSDTAGFTLTVHNVNRTPMLTAIGNQTVIAGEPLALALSADDPDGDGLVFSVNGPDFISLQDNNDGTAGLVMTPVTKDAGLHNITVTVTDTGTPVLSASETFSLQVDSIGYNIIPATIDFGDITVGNVGVQSFAVANTGTLSLQVSGIQSSNAAFSVFAPAAFTIAPGGAAHTVSINFTPTGEGDFSGTLTILSNTGVPHEVSITGRGITIEDETLQVESPLVFTLEEKSNEAFTVEVTNPGTEVRTAAIGVINPHPDLHVFVTSPDLISLSPGQSNLITLEIDTTQTVAGTYENIMLELMMDDGNTIYAGITVNVLPMGSPDLPDLAVKAADIRAMAYIDNTVTIGATIHNKGSLPAENTVVQFYEFNTLLGEVEVAEILAGENGVAAITIPMPAAGDRLIQVVIDPLDSIEERDETNNEATKILSLDPQEARDGFILITGSAPATVCTGRTFTVAGKAVYDLVVNGIRYNDYVLKGGLVEITLVGPAGEEWHYSGGHTDIYGTYSQVVQAPVILETYHLIITVTDGTFIGTRELVLEATDCSYESSPPQPYYGGGGSGGSGGGSGNWNPVGGGGSGDPVDWEWEWTTPPQFPPDVPVPQSDLFVYSENIHFSVNNPEKEEVITIFTEIRYWAESTSLVAEDIPINFYATYPGMEKVKIGESVIDSLSVGWPDFGSQYVFTSWRNDLEGIYIIEVEIDPGYIETNILNNAATRAIIVGDLACFCGIIEGQVTDIQGGVSDVVIDLYDADFTTLIESRLTDTNGYYLFENMPVGVYQVHIRTPKGYQADAETKPADVVDQTITTVNFFLTMIQGPVADAGGPYSGQVGSEITLDAGGSYDPDGDIVLYEWDLDNNGVYELTTSDPQMPATWDAPFTGTIGLRVTDNNGLTDTDTAEVDITAESLCGDLDHDGDVDGNDRNIFFSSFRACTGGSNFIPEADYDGDGCVGLADYRDWFVCYKAYLAL